MGRAAPAFALAALLSAAAAAAAPPPRLTAAGPVTALAADKGLVAFATGDSRRECDRVAIWDVRAGRVTRLGRRTSCEATSTGRGVGAVALAGSRVLWLHYAGGNIREYSLFTASTTSPAPRRLQFVARDVDDVAPIVLGKGDASRLGDILPYALGDLVIALDSRGRRTFTWRAPARVTALGATAGGLAVATADGTVTTLDSGGAVELSSTGTPPATAAFVTGSSVVVQRARTVEVIGGTQTRTFQLPAGARLLDAAGTRAVYGVRGTIRELELTGGRDRLVARGALAALEPPRLVVAAGRDVSARALR